MHGPVSSCLSESQASSLASPPSLMPQSGIAVKTILRSSPQSGFDLVNFVEPMLVLRLEGSQISTLSSFSAGLVAAPLLHPHLPPDSLKPFGMSAEEGAS